MKKQIYQLFVCSLILGFFALTVQPGQSQSLQTKSSTGQSSKTSDTNFSVLTTVFGVDNKTGNVVAFVGIHNVTQGVVLNAAERDGVDGKKDGIFEIYFTFPGLKFPIGEKFRACVLVLNDFRMMCKEGHNSPTERSEYAEIYLPLSKPLKLNMSGVS